MKLLLALLIALPAHAAEKPAALDTQNWLETIGFLACAVAIAVAGPLLSCWWQRRRERAGWRETRDEMQDRQMGP